MLHFIYVHRLDVDIIDLHKILLMLHLTLNFLAHITYHQDIILFLTCLPDVCIFTPVLSPPHQIYPALSDSNKLLVPTVVLYDTDCNTNIIAYSILSNDE